MRTIQGQDLLTRILGKYPAGTLSPRAVILNINTDDPQSLITRLNPIISDIVWQTAIELTTPEQVQAKLQSAIKKACSE